MPAVVAPLLAISFGEFLWSLLIIYFMIIFFVILFQVIIDVFQSPDLTGWGKAGWTILIFVVPLIGLLAYVIARGDNMHRRRAQAASDSQQAFDDYVRDVAGGTAAEIAEAKKLLDAGAISDDEFQAIKQKALA